VTALLRYEDLSFLADQRLFVEPKDALRVRFVDGPGMVGAALAGSQVLLMKEIANSGLVVSD
jgi:hypothetical protein